MGDNKSIIHNTFIVYVIFKVSNNVLNLFAIKYRIQ